jgi:integrase
MRVNEAIWIEKRQRWQINVRHDGERKTFTSSIPGKKGKIEAERKADKWLESKKIESNIRFDKLYAEFLESIKPPITGTANYKKHEQMGRNYLSPRVQHKRVKEIKIQDWQNCIDDAAKNGLAFKTCKNVRASITAFYRYAKKRGIEMRQPEDLTIPNSAPVGEKKILQPNEIKTLFLKDTIKLYNKDVPCFFIHAWRFIMLNGFRRGEVCGLKKEDIKDDILTIRRSINEQNEETKGKNRNARRSIALSIYSLIILEDQERMLKLKGIISPWVFPDEYGNRLDPRHLYRKWNTYKKQHGLSSNLHEMRHTMISVTKADLPESLLNRVVGHSKTIGTYRHDVDGELNRAANIIDNVFDKILE